MASNTLSSIKKKRDFEHLKDQGRAVHISHWLLVVSLPNQEGINRVGWTLSRFVGTAVVRNRLKRWGREQIKNWNTEDWPETLNLNFVFKRKQAGFYRDLSREEFRIVFEKAFKKLSQYG